MPKLFQQHAAVRRSPILVKRHSRFVGGLTITVVGTRWSRTWGILPKGERVCANCPYTWTGGMSWKIRGSEDRRTLTRPTLAICKWRYR